jgi:hypothetical protein
VVSLHVTLRVVLALSRALEYWPKLNGFAEMVQLVCIVTVRLKLAVLEETVSV